MTLATAIDKAARETIEKIRNHNKLSKRQKYDELDALMLRVMEQHPDGIAADVVREIDAAKDEFIDYPKRPPG